MTRSSVLIDGAIDYTIYDSPHYKAVVWYDRMHEQWIVRESVWTLVKRTQGDSVPQTPRSFSPKDMR